MTSDNPTASDARLGFVEQWLNGVGRLSPDDLKRARRWLAVGGVVGLIAGIASVAVPAITSVTISVFTGWLLVAAGGVMISHAVGRRPLRVTLRVIEGIATLLIGAYIVIFPLTGTISLTGNYLGSVFVASSDAHGGTSVVAKAGGFVAAMAGFALSGGSLSHPCTERDVRETLLARPHVNAA